MTDFKQRLRSGQTVGLVNADHACAGLAAFVCRLGIDAIMLDAEQGNPSFEDIEDMARAARLHGVSALVRIPSVEPWTIERYLMRDIDGLVIPRLNSAQQVKTALADIRYVVPREIEAKTIIVQIESAQAVAELDEFLALPEVDCFFIGAVDLAKSMGFAGDYRQPAVMDTMTQVLQRIRAQGRAAGFLVKDHDLQYWQARGATMLYTHVNDFIQMGLRQWNTLAGLPAELRARPPGNRAR
ncbi:HpcH/HpaI aldolase/citrate lyase family protein [Bordetella sp. BOR01]|uniref:HpcH/HpaI aldolase family protein n=1 Tax=Bordetella sp. BOR01 TaxID=2854779 RepID=UPI001C448717|nr:aldolase/citrate lyase family protein [Bordetella sp. BOR01]MBV7485325.1 2,4-dihydroxyhept-2-ene-1,7-dioic acid aldolase [Bordetella sp. BOR01]